MSIVADQDITTQHLKTLLISKINLNRLENNKMVINLAYLAESNWRAIIYKQEIQITTPKKGGSGSGLLSYKEHLRSHNLKDNLNKNITKIAK